MGINNPVPRSLSSECRKAARILASFVKPNQLLGQDSVIPPEVLRNAHGLAIITQLKAGFLFSGRAGSGVIVSRLSDGSWSAPSALVTAGAGVGGQIGAELTDFVFILNDQAAVDTFSHAGSITLGGNISIAAGPLGRNAEVAGSASRSSVAAIFSYSKTKGLFAGVSLEGSVLVERRDANRKFYGQNCTAKLILSGRVDPPPECDVLFRVLESRAFSSARANYDDGDFYDDIPDNFSDSTSAYERPARGGSRRYGGSRGGSGYDEEDDGDYDRRDTRSSNARSQSYKSENSWEDDYYDRPSVGRRGTTSSRVRGSNRSGGNGHDDDEDIDQLSSQMGRSNFRSTYSDNPSRSDSTRSPGRPNAPKPSWRDETDVTNSSSRGGYGYDDDDDDGYQSRRNSNRRRGTTSDAPARYDAERHAQRQREVDSQAEVASSGGQKAVALYSFTGEQPGDLDFRKGDIITIVKRSESRDDWWTGRRGTKEGIFPANYVETV